MLRYIFRYDLKKLHRDNILRFNFFMVFLLSALSLNKGNSWLEFRRDVISDIQETRRMQYDTQMKDGEAYDLAHDTVGLDSPNSPFVIYWGLRGYAYELPSSFSVLAIGQSDLYPFYSMITGVKKQALLMEEEIQNPLNLFTGKADYLFFFIYILPLLVIAITFDLLASEKETGTFNLLKTQGAPIYRLMAYKCFVRMAGLSLMVLFSFFTWMFVFEPGIFSAVYFSELMTCMVLGFLYIVFWFVLAYFVNSYGKSSVVNGTGLIAAWIIFLFFIPTLVNIFATSMYPVPSRNEQALLEREITISADVNKEKILDAYLSAHPAYRKENADTSGKVAWIDWYFGFLATQNHMEQLTSPYEEDIRKAVARQQLLCDNLRFLSPALVLNHYVHHIAKTSLYQQLDYAKSLDLFKNKWSAFIRDKIFKREKFQNEDFKCLPHFNMYSFYTFWSGEDILLNFITFVIGIFLLTFLGSRRYKNE